VKCKGTRHDIQTRERDGHPVSFFRAFWRNTIRIVIGYFYILVVLFVIQIITFMKTKKLFHDQLSNTVIGEKLENQN